MIIITLARKPITGTVAQNAVCNGTGGINIDACRIGASFVSSGGNNFNAWRAGEGRPDRPILHGKSTAIIASGRWPANLIFEHLPECCCTGTKDVSGSYLNHDCHGVAFSAGAGPIKHKMGYASPDGTERVDAWDCNPNCPVGDLDDQSGIRTSGTGAVKRTSGTGYQAAAYGRESQPIGTPNIEHGDSGSASRFFKQIQDEK